MILLAQYLCPARHCLFALPIDADEGDRDAFAALFGKLVARAIADGFNPWCGLCGSTELKVEVGKTGFLTLEEAQPHLQEMERQNLETRARLHASGEAYDAKVLREKVGRN